MPQDIEKNKQTMRYFYEQTNAGNLSVYDELFAPDFVSYSSAVGQELRGPEALKQANVLYSTAFPDFRLDIDIIIAEGAYVMVYGPGTGTFSGPFMAIPPNNAHLRWTGIAIYRFNDEGKIDGRWQEFDGIGMFTQMGVIPPMGGGSA
jgi:predicted ester cyclase